MNLYRLLQQRADQEQPVRTGLIGAGKFGSMFLSQVPSTPGLEVAAIADLNPDRAKGACTTVGWDDHRLGATTFLDSGVDLCAREDIEVVIEATGHPAPGIAHARAAIAAGKHIVMVNVEAHGLAFPPCGVDDLPHILRSRDQGGVLERDGIVEVVSSLERDGRPVYRDLRWGVYVVVKAPTDYAAACFAQYGMKTDSSGFYAAMYKPFHLIGLELGISVLSAALRKEPTGQTRTWRADVASVAKRDLKAGDMLDGEGGFTVWGKLLPAESSLCEDALPIGLAHNVKLVRDVPEGRIVRRKDVETQNSEAVRVR